MRTRRDRAPLPPRRARRASLTRFAVPLLSGSYRVVQLTLRLPYRTSFGQNLAIVGSSDVFGNWDPNRSLKMSWTADDVWQVDVAVPSQG